MSLAHFLVFVAVFSLFSTADVEVDRVRVIGRGQRLGLGTKLDREWQGCSPRAPDPSGDQSSLVLLFLE